MAFCASILHLINITVGWYLTGTGRRLSALLLGRLFKEVQGFKCHLLLVNFVVLYPFKRSKRSNLQNRIVSLIESPEFAPFKTTWVLL